MIKLCDRVTSDQRSLAVLRGIEEESGQELPEQVWASIQSSSNLTVKAIIAALGNTDCFKMTSETELTALVTLAVHSQFADSESPLNVHSTILQATGATRDYAAVYP